MTTNEKVQKLFKTFQEAKDSDKFDESFKQGMDFAMDTCRIWFDAADLEGCDINMSWYDKNRIAC